MENRNQSKGTINKGVMLISVVCVFVALGFGYFIGNQQAVESIPPCPQCPEYTCQQISGELERIQYEANSYEIEFVQSEDEFLIHVLLRFADQSVTFDEGDKFYVTLSFDGTIPYSLDQAEQDVLTIELDEHHHLPGLVEFTVSSDDYHFSDEDLEKVNAYLGKESDNVVLSVNIFDPDKRVSHVINHMLTN